MNATGRNSGELKGKAQKGGGRTPQLRSHRDSEHFFFFLSFFLSAFPFRSWARSSAYAQIILPPVDHQQATKWKGGGLEGHPISKFQTLSDLYVSVSVCAYAPLLPLLSLLPLGLVTPT
ncbi:hypothetical protein FS842_003737 [Serendipita sp. 407]|nr:hypothetical protein FS842_003737 [Serendipita sp. 407]